MVLYGMEPPIDCADSNDCSCNEMMLTTEIDHLSLLVIEQVSSEVITRQRGRGNLWIYLTLDKSSDVLNSCNVVHLF